jgi:NADH:ubiquinone oxidoreductase subunit E
MYGTGVFGTNVVMKRLETKIRQWPGEFETHETYLIQLSCTAACARASAMIAGC